MLRLAGVLLTTMIMLGPIGCMRSSESQGSARSPLIEPATTSGGTPDWARDDTAPGNTSQVPAAPQAMSLLGTPLYPPALPDDIRARRQEQLYEAQIMYDRDPHDERAIIWLGRRQAYLGEYRAAIDTFSNGLALDPTSYRLLRHRGHRWITVRQFDNAIADLTLAAAIIEADAIADEIEPDGQPNARNIPTSTSHSNIYYHLGLALYLQGEFSEAADAWRKCLEHSKNDDMRVAATYWLYLAMLRAGDRENAQALLTTISTDMDIIENHSYHQLLLVFKGDADVKSLEPKPGASGDISIDLATVGYGLGVQALLADDHATARKRFEDVVENSNWAAFGHIAAEAELAGASIPSQ